MQESQTLMDCYHQLQRQGDADGARARLALALQVPAYRGEAQLCLGIEAMQTGDYQQAFLQFAQAANSMPKRSDIVALMGHAAMAQHKPELAVKLLEAAWRKDPTHAALRIALWQARLASQPSADTVQQMLVALEFITDGNELRLVLNELARRTPAGTIVGTVRYRPVEGIVEGWAVDLHAPQMPATLELTIGERSTTFLAKAPLALLAQAGWPATHGAFRIKTGPQASAVHLRGNAMDLCGSPVAAAPVLAGVPGHFFKPPEQSDEKSPPDTSTTVKKTPAGKSGKHGHKPPANLRVVDVLIPVYEGLEETLACIHSVLRYRQANRTPHEVVVLNDATPNAQLAQALSTLAQAGKIKHVIRPANLGFIRNINRGMALHPDRDVVWLNADTQVHGNWLDRLRDAAYASKKTASATPFTNNGELLSFPESRVCHPMPSPQELAQLDLLAKKLPNTPVPIETGCGFCLFIKRSALDEVGYLDEIELLRGYGEETDWCLRAKEKGWQHVAATNVFVAHQGGVSFKDEKVLRVKHNNDILRNRYPLAERRFEAIGRNDPLEPARQELQRARLALVPTWLRQSEERACLVITGSLREGLGLTPIQAPVTLSFRNQGQATRLALRVNFPGLPLTLHYKLPADDKRLEKDLRALKLDSIALDQRTGCPDSLLALPALLGIPQVPLHSENAKDHHNGAINWPPALVKELPYVLIADSLHNASLAKCWLAIAKHLASAQTAGAARTTLLLAGNSPARHELLALGSAAVLPEIDGLDLADTAQLAGCAVAVSICSNPKPDWLASQIAGQADIPLYAPSSKTARQAGAVPLAALTFAAPWLTPAALPC